MSNPRENIVRRVGGGGEDGGSREPFVALAIDKDKTSQHAIKWAIDNVLSRDQSLRLIHVRERSHPTSGSVRNGHAFVEPQIDPQTMELLLPFRCFCRRSQVHYEAVILEETDVVKALIQYVCQNGVATLRLGAATRTGLSRLFKTADIPGSVLKWAPDFCTVYVISKGKINSVKHATRPVPPIPGTLQHYSNVESSVIEGDKYDELSMHDVGAPLPSSGRSSVESVGLAFYENTGSRRTGDSVRGRSNFEQHQDSSNPSIAETESGSPSFPQFNRLDSAIPTSVSDSESREEKIKRLEIELKQTMDMYHAACKEALVAKQKAKQLEEWKRKEEKRLKETLLAEETAMTLLEREKLKCKAATDAAEAAQKRVKIEVQKRVIAELKAVREADVKDRVLDALGQSDVAIKYQSLFHMVSVLFLFYLYFSILG